ncbi:DUF1484 family protein [Cupriavidus necator]
MQERTTSKHETVLAAIPVECLESLDRISAGLGSVLSLLEVESERSEACHGVHCLLAMIKSQLDQTAEELCPAEPNSSIGANVSNCVHVALMQQWQRSPKLLAYPSRLCSVGAARVWLSPAIRSDSSRARLHNISNN